MRASFLIFIPMALLALAHPRGANAGGMSASQSAKEIEDIGRIEPLQDGDGEGQPKFRASVQVRSEFSTNAKLSGNHSSGDLIFFPQIEIGFNAPLPHNFSFDIAAKVESGIYTQHQERGFVGYSIISTLDWRPKLNWPRIYIGAEPYRYDSFDTGDRITQAIGLTAGTDWGYSFNKGYSLAFVGYSFTDYFAEPSMDSRQQHKAIVGLTHEFTPRLFATLFYQFSYSDYQNISRNDYRHLLGANATYQLSKKVFSSLTASFSDNDSTQDFASYQSFNISLGVTVQF